MTTCKRILTEGICSLTDGGRVRTAGFTCRTHGDRAFARGRTVDIGNRACGCFDGSLVTDYYRIFRRRFGFATDCDGRFSRCLSLQTYRSCTIGSRRSIYACSKRVVACRTVIVVVAFSLIFVFDAVKMSLRRTGQLTVNNLDGVVIHLNVVFDFSIAVCFSIDSNGSRIAIGKLHAFAGRNNALRRTRIIFDGKALVDVSIEIGQRAAHAGCGCRIEFGCTAACGIRCCIAFKHIIRRQRYRTLTVCRISTHSRAATQCIGNRFGDIARTSMKRVKLAAINCVCRSLSNRTRRNIFKLAFVAFRTKRNL